jgi:hypothetical protein
MSWAAAAALPTSAAMPAAAKNPMIRRIAIPSYCLSNKAFRSPIFG